MEIKTNEARGVYWKSEEQGMFPQGSLKLLIILIRVADWPTSISFRALSTQHFEY